MSKGIRSNSDVFESRGDPWVSEREGQKDFGRSVRTENPDYDRYFVKKAEKRQDKASEPRKAPAATDRRKISGVLNRMHMEMGKTNKVYAPKVRVVLPPPKLSKAGSSPSPKGYFVYHKMKDGPEEDAERSNLKAAEKSFDRRTKREGVVLVELWSTASGELLKAWTPNPKAKGG